MAIPPPKRLKHLGLVLALVGLAGIAAEQIGRHRDRTRYPLIGKSIDIGGRTLNISCLGQGKPAVVFDTYGHQSGYSWIAVQSEVARRTRACWYDRAGYGWSELGPSPRTFASVAADLHTLLREAGVPTPVVLVGAGDAASHIRVYNGSYPSEIAGIVMIDANDVDDPAEAIPDSEKGGFQRIFGKWAAGPRTAACAVRPFLGRLGIIRLASLFSAPRDTVSYGLTAQQQAELNDLSDNATTQQATEACAREESMQQVRASRGLRHIPLVVMASNAGRPESSPQITKVPNALAGLSTNGRVVLMEGGIGPAEIVRSILGLLPADAGSR